MEFRKTIQVASADSGLMQRMVAFWQERGFVFHQRDGDVLEARRGSLRGNLTSFDMSKLRAALTITVSSTGGVECLLRVNTMGQVITPYNEVYWHLELATFESWLLRGDRKEAAWGHYRHASLAAARSAADLGFSGPGGRRAMVEKMLAELEDSAVLLRPTAAPEGEHLLRPAEGKTTDDAERLLRAAEPRRSE